MKQLLIKILLILFLLVLLVSTLYYVNIQSPIYQLNQNTAQFTAYQNVPEGIPSLKAQDCGLCHIEIYQEWQQTLHASAYHDPYFQAYLKKDKNDPTCLVCHTPLENQAEYILSANKGDFNQLSQQPNKKFDPALRDEGVTCVACHVRDGIVYGPYPTETMDAPHPVGYDKKFTSKSICLQCHQVPAKSFSLLKEGICSTGVEAQQGPWAEAGYICQNCHMPEINRPLMAGFPERPGRKHLWPGGYSKTQLQKVFEFKAMKENGKLNISIKNAGAGHKVPTGDSDRFIDLKFYWQVPGQEIKMLESITFKRQMIWQPIIMEWSDNRLAPGQVLNLSWDLPSEEGQLSVDGIYHVMTEWSRQRLEKNYGLSPSLPEKWNIQRPFIEKQLIPVVKQH